MVIKQKDALEPTITTLKALLELATLTEKQRDDAQEELIRIQAGASGEREAAYHIDFRLKDTENWAVIHDLRLEENGRVAQIDHLLINRMMEIFIIESKNVKTAVRFNQAGEFEVKTRWGWKGMASPIEQNKRHIRVLKDLVDRHALAPTRLGVCLSPTYHNWVLIAPECHLTRNGIEEATILKMDLFDRGLEEHGDTKTFKSVFSLAKFCSPDTVQAFARELAGFHRPAVFNYAAKFGISDAQRYSPTAPPPSKPAAVDQPICERCQASVEAKVINYCHAHAKRFGGKVLCRTCQTASAAEPVGPTPAKGASKSSCQECNAIIDAKVLAFCRLNGRRFNHRILCRTCQTVAPAASR